MANLMPEPIMHGSTGNFTMGELVLNVKKRDEADERSLWVPDQEMIAGFFLPPFQRPPVWTENQNILFLESAWMEVHLGTYVVNQCAKFDRKINKFHYTDRWLIDGQQRLRAVESYLLDGFPVFGYRWSELDKIEQRRFGTVSFARTTIQESDETKLRLLYNRLNFGGVAHTEDQRA